MKKLYNLTKKQKILIIIASLAIIAIITTIILNKEKIFEEKDKANNINGVAIKIDDRCESVLEVFETFYSDDNYDYQFSSTKSSCTYVIIDEKEYLIQEALENNIITIEEAERAGLVFFREEKVDNLNLRIEDRCEITAQALETFYSDDKYDYQFSSIKSDCTYVIFNNQEYLIKDALENNVITIEEAEAAGLQFFKVEKQVNNTKKIIIEDRCETTAQVIETFYSDSKYNYQFSSQKSGCTYAIVNDNIYPIKDALNKNIITITEAEQAGLKFTKVAKNTSSSTPSTPVTRTIKIETTCNNSSSSLTVMETIYSDNNYDYQLTSSVISCTYAVVNNTRYLIKDALNKNIITIAEAEKAGLKFTKVAKNPPSSTPSTPVTRTIKIERTCDNSSSSIMVMETIYSDDLYDYQLTSSDISCTYAVVNNTRYLIKDALNKNIITIEEAEKAGLNVFKSQKINNTIRNVCEMYLEVVEPFYSDNNYTYSFASSLSGCLYITIGGVDYLVVDALKSGLITISDIENAGINVIKTRN